MSDMRAYQVYLKAQKLAEQMLIAHTKGDAGQYNVKLGMDAFGEVCAAVHDLAAKAPERDATLMASSPHASDCAVHNPPAESAGRCGCAACEHYRDMLAALNQALWHIGTDEDRIAQRPEVKWQTSKDEAADMIRAAIAKAEGQS